ncbi:hypothetical protein CHUAL_010820 [Chamberlinius hualienensis]
MPGWLATLVFLVTAVRYKSTTDSYINQQSVCVECNNNRAETVKQSSVESRLGHWPASYCRITNVYLISSDNTFIINGDETVIDVCYGTRSIWNFKGITTEDKTGSKLNCDETFDTGYVFTIYYHHGSNYFHLHYDTTLPMYSFFYHGKNHSLFKRNRIILMPSVEKQRGKGTDWYTDAFMNESSYWIELLKVFSGNYKMLPLDKRLVSISKTFCFKEIYFGTPKFNASSYEILSGYSNMIKDRLNISSTNLIKRKRKRIGFIHRSGRRKILNEKELVKSVMPLADIELIDLNGLQFKQQVETVQKYNILIGMNGAGLINALYLPSNSVTVQMVPYAAQLNYIEYGKLLEARGPYIEWHNNHKNNTVTVPGDASHGNDDTIIDVNEFKRLIKKALFMCKD